MSDGLKGTIPPLEMKCVECDGDGRSRSSDGECFFCNGSGYIPTPLGRSIITLVQHNLKISERSLPEWRRVWVAEDDQ